MTQESNEKVDEQSAKLWRAMNDMIRGLMDLAIADKSTIEFYERQYDQALEVMNEGRTKNDCLAAEIGRLRVIVDRQSNTINAADKIPGIGSDWLRELYKHIDTLFADGVRLKDQAVIATAEIDRLRSLLGVRANTIQEISELNRSLGKQVDEIAIDRQRLAAQIDGFRAANTRLDEQVNRQACTIEAKNEVLAERYEKIASLEKTVYRMTSEAIRLHDLIKTLSIFKSSVTPTC